MPPQSLYCGDEIVGDSAQIALIKRCIDRVAPSEATILITGETGTGKELFARRVHRLSNRRGRSFISLNCAAIPDNLFESELFGFEKGAFTGACARRDGILVQADGGTIFLDEIGDLSLSAQAKLLRVLEQKEVRPLGSRKMQPVDFRLITATNRDLEDLVALGEFRQDLLFRIKVIHLHLPPLRERPEDIPLIASYFLATLSNQYSRAPVSLTLGAQRRLKQLPWAGNIRELRNIMERAFLLSTSEYITERDIIQMFGLAGCGLVRSSTSVPSSFQVAPQNQPERRVSRAGYRYTKEVSSGISELEQLRKALEETRWNKSEAAKLLRCSRMTLYRKVAQYQLYPLPAIPPKKEFISEPT